MLGFCAGINGTTDRLEKARTRLRHKLSRFCSHAADQSVGFCLGIDGLAAI
jgi:hypothetical protein